MREGAIAGMILGYLRSRPGLSDSEVNIDQVTKAGVVSLVEVRFSKVRIAGRV